MSGVSQVVLRHPTYLASLALPRRLKGEDRCPYGSGKPSWIALSSFHPPVVSVATDSQVVAFPTLHAKMGHAIDPFEWVFAFAPPGSPQPFNVLA